MESFECVCENVMELLRRCQRLPESFTYFPIFTLALYAHIQKGKGATPEDGNQWSVNGVSIKHVHVVPAALGGEVIEAEPQHSVRAATHRERQME